MFERRVITRAITLTQPWATLVAIGAKKIETRSWQTSYRGWIGIHASKAFPASSRVLCYSCEPFRRHLLKAGYRSWHELPIGALVGAANLTDILTAPAPELGMMLGEDEFQFGDFSDGRKLWLLADPHRFMVPQTMPGKLSIWTLPRAFEISEMTIPV